MITIGIDPHKDTHTAAAVEDATGQLLGELTVPGTRKPPLQAVESCR